MKDYNARLYKASYRQSFPNKDYYYMVINPRIGDIVGYLENLTIRSMEKKFYV